jgi:hypothetical protein
MTIGEIVRQGFHYARTCKWLWLFGFVVGVASGGGSGGGGGGGGEGTGTGGVPLGLLPGPVIAAIALVILAAIIAAIVLRFVSEGALIEGVVRARQGGTMTMREGFRAGWAHWGVLVRIWIAYAGAIVGSLVLAASPIVIAVRAAGAIGGVAVGIPVLIVAVPWLVTVHLVQAFASRIAVLENRRALDAIAKARLFLHGRLLHGLRLIVATLVGTLAIAIVGVVVVVPLVLSLVALVPVLPVYAVIVLGGLVLLPAIYVLTAILGTFRSSIWTIGYVTEVEA